VNRFNHHLNEVLQCFRIAQYVINEIQKVMKVSNGLRKDALYRKLNKTHYISTNQTSKRITT